jgi:hypothetical protein
MGRNFKNLFNVKWLGLGNIKMSALEYNLR